MDISNIPIFYDEKHFVSETSEQREIEEIEENISEQMEENATVLMNLNQTSTSNFFLPL